MTKYYKRFFSYNKKNDTTTYYKVDDNNVLYILDDDNNWVAIYTDFQKLIGLHIYKQIDESEMMLEML
jgi:hypothetical protein